MDSCGKAPYKKSMNVAGTPFLKMHGLGNDFMIVDTRRHPFDPSAEQVRALGDRRTGIGFDQLVTIETPRQNGTVFMGIRNSDGTIVENCGNAARCVGAMLLLETHLPEVILETLGGPLTITAAPEGRITVDMGPARVRWDEIPLAHEVDTISLPIVEGPLANPVAVSMGNPHAVFFVPDAEAIDLTAFGPRVEHHPLFPNRTNVEIIEIRSDGSLRMRVWERGAGITKACGTGACAALVAAISRGFVRASSADVHLDGGTLFIERRESDGHILMTGTATLVYSGVTLAAGREL